MHGKREKIPKSFCTVKRDHTFTCLFPSDLSRQPTPAVLAPPGSRHSMNKCRMSADGDSQTWRRPGAVERAVWRPCCVAPGRPVGHRRARPVPPARLFSATRDKRAFTARPPPHGRRCEGRRPPPAPPSGLARCGRGGVGAAARMRLSRGSGGAQARCLQPTP